MAFRARDPLDPPSKPALHLLNLVHLGHPSGASAACSLTSFFNPGMNVLESSPYEPFIRGFDYVRLASITAGRWVGRCSYRDWFKRGNWLWDRALWTRQSYVVFSQSIDEILQSIFQGAACDFWAILLVEEHVLGRITCDFQFLAFSCPYCEGLGLRDVEGKPLPMSHHRWADSP